MVSPWALSPCPQVSLLPCPAVSGQMPLGGGAGAVRDDSKSQARHKTVWLAEGRPEPSS